MSEARGVDLAVEIHPKVRGLLLQAQWAEARSLLKDIRQELETEGFQADGLRVVAGKTWKDRSQG